MNEEEKSDRPGGGRILLGGRLPRIGKQATLGRLLVLENAGIQLTLFDWAGDSYGLGPRRNRSNENQEGGSRGDDDNRWITFVL